MRKINQCSILDDLFGIAISVIKAVGLGQGQTNWQICVWRSNTRGSVVGIIVVWAWANRRYRVSALFYVASSPNRFGYETMCAEIRSCIELNLGTGRAHALFTWTLLNENNCRRDRAHWTSLVSSPQRILFLARSLVLLLLRTTLITNTMIWPISPTSSLPSFQSKTSVPKLCKDYREFQFAILFHFKILFQFKFHFKFNSLEWIMMP